MNWQMLLLETQFLAGAVDRLLSPPPVRKSATAKFLTGLAIAFILLGLAATGTGVYLWLSEMYAPRDVALIMGALGLSTAAICGGAGWLIVNHRMLHRRVKERVIRHKVQDLAAAMTDEFGDTVRQYPKTTAALAALAGLAIGDYAVRNGHVNELVRETKNIARQVVDSKDKILH